jgi:oxalate---CoA ligase
MPDSCLYHFIASQADQTPDAIAIVAPSGPPLTYGRLRSQVEHVVTILNAVGIGRNDRVAMVLPDGPQAAVAFLGVASGATCAPLNPQLRASEFAFFLTNLHAKAIVVRLGSDSPARDVAQRQGITVIELSPEEVGGFTLVGNEHAGPLRTGFAETEDVALVLPTSGTTSRSKLVPLTHANIYAAARNVRTALGLTCNDRYLNVTRLFYSQGIMLTIASLYAGASVICPSAFSVDSFFKAMEEFHPTWYSAAPTIHQALLAQAHSNRATIRRYPLRLIRSAAAPLPPSVLTELERVFHAPVIEGYGMTECYPITSNPLPPGRRKAGSVGVAVGADIAIMDDAGNLLPSETIGEIVVSGPQVMRGYFNDSTTDASAFTHGWFRTGDQGYVDPDGYLFITGRLKEIINRGGEKIAPREVDEVLLEHPAVAEAVTFAVPHVTLGEDVAAAVVLRHAASVRNGDIERFAATRLAEFKVPRQLLIVEQIPKSATGKVQRIDLAEKLGLTRQDHALRATTGSPNAPRTPLEKKLVAIWASVLGLAAVGIYDNFFDIGGHSLLAVQIVAQIQVNFGKHLPVPALFRATTIARLAQLLEQEAWPESWDSLVPIQPRGSKPPFFWVYGDASAAFLPRYLGPDQPIYALHHQSQDGRPARYTQVETIAARALEEIRTVQSQGPYFLGGFSFGGTLAFEIAQQLKKQGEEVALLYLLDSHFPGESVPGSASEKTNSPSFRDELRRHLYNLSLIGTKEKLAYLSDRIIDKLMQPVIGIRQTCKKIACKVCVRAGIRLSPSLQSVYLLGIYSKALRRYQPQRYPGRAIYVKSELRSGGHRVAWEKLMDGGLEVYEVPGNHTDLIQESYGGLWAKHLRTWLDLAQEILDGKQKRTGNALTS